MAGDPSRFGMSSSFPGAYFGSSSDGAGPAHRAGPIVPDEPESVLLLDADSEPALLDLRGAGEMASYSPATVQIGFSPSMMGHHQPVTPQHRQPTVGFGAGAAAAGGHGRVAASGGAGAAAPSTPVGPGAGGRVQPAQASLWFSQGHPTSKEKTPTLTDVAVQSMFCAVRPNPLARPLY